MRFLILGTCLVLVFLQASAAQNIQQCETALQSSIEQASSDYSIMQSYMYVNAIYEYDEIRQSLNEGRGGGVLYKIFSLEYNESKNTDEFQKRVRDRLTKEAFSIQQQEARTNYRRFLSSDQLEKWAKCAQLVTGSAAIIIDAKAVSIKNAFPIRISWFLPRGVGFTQLVVKVDNATIDGQNGFNSRMEGSNEKQFIIRPIGTVTRVVITAEIPGASDSAVYQEPPLPPRPAITVLAKDFLRGQDVALGGPPSYYFGDGVLLNAPPYNARPNAAEWEFVAVRGGNYTLKAEYAAEESRPVRIILNGNLAIDNAMNASTGCWSEKCQQLLVQGRVNLKNGLNVMRVERNSVFPHIRKFIFEPLN